MRARPESPPATPAGAPLARAQEHVLAQFPRWFPSLPFERALAVVRFDRLAEASSYPLYVCDIAPRPGEPFVAIIVKFTPVYGEHREGAVEFDHLTRMHARLGGGGELRVPRPLDFLPDVSALFMERVGGDRFSRVLLSEARFGAGSRAADRLAVAAGRCGAWLREYHGEFARPPVPAFGPAFTTRVEQGLDLLAGFGFPVAVARAVTSASAALAARGGNGCLVPSTVQHGDFGPQNVHIDDAFVCVFDPSHHLETAVYDDITYFLVTLDTLNPYPRALRFDRARARALRVPFLTGYFGPAGPDSSVVLEGYYLKALIARALKQRRNTAARGRVALALFDRVYVHHRYPAALMRQVERVTRTLESARA